MTKSIAILSNDQLNFERNCLTLVRPIMPQTKLSKKSKQFNIICFVLFKLLFKKFLEVNFYTEVKLHFAYESKNMTDNATGKN